MTESPAETEEETATDTEEWTVDPVDHDKNIGAFYAQWLRGDDGLAHSEYLTDTWTEYTTFDPVLDAYESREEDVINQHIQWAVNHGINFFVANGPAWVRERLWQAELSDEIDWALLLGVHNYETKENGRIDFGRQSNRERLTDTFRMLDRDFFGDDHYFRVDDRPLLFLYSINRATGDVEGAFDAARDAIEHDPYLIADFDMWTSPGGAGTENRAPAFDAFGTFAPYRPMPETSSLTEDTDRLNDALDERYEEWRHGLQQSDIDFVPTVGPGYDDTRDAKKIAQNDVHPVIERTPDAFRQACRDALKYLDPDLNLALVSTWNGWREGTQVEPAEEYGTTFLEVIEEELARGDPDQYSHDPVRQVDLAFDSTTDPGGGRSLAFQADHIRFEDDTGETISEFDLGTGNSAKAVYNLDTDPDLAVGRGVYNPEQGSETTFRWLGGPTETATFFLGEDAAPATAVLSGRPYGAAEATIHVDGEPTGQVAFDDGPSDYRIPLTTEG